MKEQEALTAARRGPHYAWYILAACCCIQFGGCGIMQNTLGIFMPPTCRELGFTTAQYSMGMTIGNLVNMLLLPAAGSVIRRCRPRVFITLCLLTCQLSLAATAFFQELWQWYIANAIRGAAGAFLYMVMSPIILNQWFRRKVGLAVGVAMAFSGVGGAVMSPVGTWMIGVWGWRTATLLVAAVSFLVTVPASLLVLHARPADIGMKPYGWEEGDDPAPEGAVGKGPRAAGFLRERCFWLLVAATVIISLPTVFNNHLPEFGQSVGLGTQVGALMSTFCLTGNVGGKLLLGWLDDRIGTRRCLLAGALACAAGTGIILMGGGWAPMYLGSLLFGACMSLTAVGVPLMVRDLYAGPGYDSVLSFCSTATSAIQAVAVGGVGFLYDLTGSYRSFLYICLALYLFLVFLVKPLYRAGEGRPSLS